MRRFLITSLLALAGFSWFATNVVEPAFQAMREQAEAAVIAPLEHIEQLEQLSNDPENFIFE